MLFVGNGVRLWRICVALGGARLIWALLSSHFAKGLFESFFFFGKRLEIE